MIEPDRAGAGTRLSFERELFGRQRELLDAAEATRIAEQLVQRRSQLLSYYTLLALFGPTAHGAPILTATSEKIAERLALILGKSAPDHAGLANALRFRHEPIDVDPRSKT